MSKLPKVLKDKKTTILISAGIVGIFALIILTAYILSLSKYPQEVTNQIDNPSSYPQVSEPSSYPISYNVSQPSNLKDVNADNYITIDSKKYFSFNLQGIDLGLKDRLLNVYNFKISSIDGLQINKMGETRAYIEGNGILIYIFVGLGETGGIYEFTPDPVSIPNKLNVPISRIKSSEEIIRQRFNEGIASYDSTYFYTSDTPENIRAHKNCLPQGIRDPYCGDQEITYTDRLNESNHIGVFCSIENDSYLNKCDDFIKNLEIKTIKPLIFQNQSLLNRNILVLNGQCDGPQSGITLYGYKDSDYTKGYAEINNNQILENNNQLNSYFDIRDFITSGKRNYSGNDMLRGGEFLALTLGCTGQEMYIFESFSTDFTNVDKAVAEIGLHHPQAILGNLSELFIGLKLYAIKGDYVFKIESTNSADKIFNINDFNICYQEDKFGPRFFTCLSERYNNSSPMKDKARQLINELKNNFLLSN